MDAMRLSVLRDFCDQIQNDPFQARYRGLAYGSIFFGWDQRLSSYFWPKPEIGMLQTMTDLEPILKRAESLATVIDHGDSWNKQQASEAIQLASSIFSWGGVRQQSNSVEKVEAVLRSALTGQVVAGAPMNSGWTKVAAFGSAWLEKVPNRTPQTIWDSCVSSSLLRRLDRILLALGIDDPCSLFGKIGRVRGRNGRPGRLSLRWPNGYGSWTSQFAGSLVIQDIRNILNSEGYPPP